MRQTSWLWFAAGLTFSLVACFPEVHANDERPSNHSVGSVDSTVSVRTDSGSYSSGGTATARGGSGIATGGSGFSEAIVGDVGGGASNASTGDVTVNSKGVKQAPDVAVFGSPSTAEFMVCYGFGGSAKDGAATGLYCRLQPELYAEHRADKYAAGGNPARAAATWCARKIHRKDFASHDNCLVEMEIIYTAMATEDVPRETCPECPEPEVSVVPKPSEPGPDYESLYLVASAEAVDAVKRAEAAERVAKLAVLEAQNATKAAMSASDKAKATSERIEAEQQSQRGELDAVRARLRPIHKDLCEEVDCE